MKENEQIAWKVMASALENILPEHKASLHFDHNPHTATYDTVESFIEWRQLESSDWTSAEQYEKAVKTQTMWMLQCYPDSPGGFFMRASCDLSALLQWMANEKA